MSGDGEQIGGQWVWVALTEDIEERIAVVVSQCVVTKWIDDMNHDSQIGAKGHNVTQS
jgi:hypothetical protein